MAISLFVYLVSFSGKFYFWGNYFFTLPQSNYFDEAGVTSEVLLFLRSFLFLEQSPLGSSQFFSEQLPLLRKTSTKQPLLENRQFFKVGTFENKDLFDGETAQNKNIFGRGTFSNQALLRSINFFRRVTFWKKLISRKCNIPHCLLFLDTYFFRVATFLKKNLLSIAATFSEELLFYNILFPKRYYFTATFPFHSYTSYLSVSNYVSSIQVGYNKSLGVLSCVSINAQSRVID